MLFSDLNFMPFSFSIHIFLKQYVTSEQSMIFYGALPSVSPGDQICFIYFKPAPAHIVIGVKIHLNDLLNGTDMQVTHSRTNRTERIPLKVRLTNKSEIP